MILTEQGIIEEMGYRVAEIVNRMVEDEMPDIVESMRDLTDEELVAVYGAMQKGYQIIPPVLRNKGGEAIPQVTGSRRLFKVKSPAHSTEESSGN